MGAPWRLRSSHFQICLMQVRWPKRLYESRRMLSVTCIRGARRIKSFKAASSGISGPVIKSDIHNNRTNNRNRNLKEKRRSTKNGFV